MACLWLGLETSYYCLRIHQQGSVPSFHIGKSPGHFSITETQARWFYTVSNSRKRRRICIIGFGNNYLKCHRNNRTIRRNNYNS